jgi:hypothetical protein
MGLKPRSHGNVSMEVVVERKQGEMAGFVVVPARRVAVWGLTETTTVEGTLDGVAIGRRSLRRRDGEGWVIELPGPLFAAVGKEAGGRARLVIRVASVDLPAELQTLVESVPEARERWEARTVAQKRMLREEVLAARTPATRERRARLALLPAPRARVPRVAGLGAEARRVVVRIVGERLPGRSCGPYGDVCVGFVQKVGCHPDGFVSADAAGATWETAIEVREKDGVPAFRGPAVNGPPHERFLYLTWIGREGGGPPAMFRRAKLRLDAIPGDVLAGALESGVLVGRLGLTAGDGMPVCASVRPPAISWSATR